MSTDIPLTVLKPADYATDQDVRWCPGCGDYSILAQMKKTLASMNVSREKTVFVSGIGCSSRFPYYMNTYGFHSIHGRAPALATGIKTVRPDLDVWVITGDGDALSIGGNHLMHAIRRNLDLNIILFNNRIYGLTKGQYSPTSPQGQVTKSTPLGAIDNPLHPLSIAIGCEATFVARTIDTNIKHMEETLRRAAQHRGTSFVEVYQNCVVFNDGAFDYATKRDTKADTVVEIEHGKPLIFGKDRTKGIRLNGTQPEVVELGKGISEDDLLFHDERSQEPTLAYLLSRMSHPEFPEPIGVFRAVEAPRYDMLINAQIADAQKAKGPGDLSKLFGGGETWTVEAQEQAETTIAPAAGKSSSTLEERICKDVIESLQPHSPYAVTSDTPVGEVLKLLVDHGVGCALIVDNDKVVGIFSERDALNKLGADAALHKDKPVSQFMTPQPQSLESADKIAFALQRMDLGGYRHVPILREGKPVGVISIRDILRYVTDLLATSA